MPTVSLWKDVMDVGNPFLIQKSNKVKIFEKIKYWRQELSFTLVSVK